jgi:hypothetical protein
VIAIGFDVDGDEDSYDVSLTTSKSTVLKSCDVRHYAEVAKRMHSEPSAPDTQSQYGNAERSGGVIKTSSRTRSTKTGVKLPAHL